ncbi:MAG: TlpA family protein disulfide reductase [Acidimicrobiia bacterium]
MRSRTALVSAGALGVVLAVLVFVLATSDSAAERQPKSKLLGEQAPALDGPLLIGDPGFVADGVATYDVPDAGGRWLLVNFFATDCIPCRIEHPELVRFAGANPDEARVVSVVFGDKAENVRAFFEEKGGDWPVVDDPDGAIAVRWGVVKVPESYLVAPNGTVVSKITGGVDYARLQDLFVRARGGS